VESWAQQGGKLVRVGFLSTGNPKGFAGQVEALRQGLRDHGYVEGKNAHIEYRWAEGKLERLGELAADLVRQKVDVIVTHGVPTTRAAKQATTTIPIVVAFTGDAVGMGLVTNLARPEGNVTGSSFLLPQINAKRLELLVEALPRAGYVAAVSNPNNPAARSHIPAMQKAAETLKVKFDTFNVDRPNEFTAAFDAMARSRVSAAVITQDGDFASSFRAIAEFALTHRIASVGAPEYAEAGGLLGYGANTIDLFRRVGYFVDRLLKGAKPADLPFEQPTKFDLIVNQKTARALGMPMPQSVLLRADRTID
jgi:putative ABC transport system substrate-binding protein